MRFVRITYFFDCCGHLRIRVYGVAEHRNQFESIIAYTVRPDIQVETRQKLAVRAGCNQQRLANLRCRRHRVVRMATQDHVNTVNAAGQFAIHVEAVMAQ